MHAWRVTDTGWVLSIIVLRSCRSCDRAHRTRNRTPWSVRRSWHGVRRRSVPPPWPSRPPKTAAPSRSYRFHFVIWFGCTLNLSAIWMKGSSPFKASRAILALNAGERLRLGVHTLPGRLPRSSITYPAVRFRPATSPGEIPMTMPPPSPWSASTRSCSSASTDLERPRGCGVCHRGVGALFQQSKIL